MPRFLAVFLLKKRTMINRNSLLRNAFASLFFLLTTTAFAQFEMVDEKVKLYPKTFSDPLQLAQKIDTDFSKPEEKARAIFTWIALHIKYDLKAYYTQANNGVAYSYSSPEDKLRKDFEFRQALVKKTLRTKKAVCEGYASLFVSLANAVGLEAVIVTGTSKIHETQIGKLPTASDHAWNAVKINGEWKLVDATWGAGVVDTNQQRFKPEFNDAYFFTDPKKFFLNHYPDNQKWLLTSKSPEDFAALPLYFPAYLKSNYELSAVLGHILFPKNTAVKFNIKNLKAGDELFYITSRDNIIKKLVVDAENNFIIPPIDKISGYLTFFVNQNPLVTYKIMKK